MSEYIVYDTILKRRSIRRFQEKQIERSKVEIMLKAAMAAPSACNLQPWYFIVVDDSEILQGIRECAEQGNYKAPLSIVVCGTSKHIPWDGDGWIFDCGAASQNIMLEATELGLASVCIGGFDDEALCKLLDIPEDIQPVCIIDIGYPVYERDPKTWYTEDAVHWQKFDRTKERKMRTLQDLSDDKASGIV